MSEHLYRKLERLISRPGRMVFRGYLVENPEIKVIMKKISSYTDETGNPNYEDYELEVSAFNRMKELNCPHIVEMIDNYKPEDIRVGYIILENMDGDITSLESDMWTEENIQKLERTVREAIACIHRAGYAHMDVKPGNVLYRYRDGNLEFKLTDFGTFCGEEIGDCVGGTPGYMIPEMKELAALWDEAVEQGSPNPADKIPRDRLIELGQEQDLYGIDVILKEIREKSNRDNLK